MNWTRTIRAVLFTLVATGTMAAGGVYLPSAATASPKDRVRASCRDVYQCRTASVNYPGGTISFDADAWGDRYAWATVQRDSNGTTVCRVDFKGSDGPRSWTCKLPAGRYFLGVYNWVDADVKGALRW